MFWRLRAHRYLWNNFSRKTSPTGVLVLYSADAGNGEDINVSVDVKPKRACDFVDKMGML